MLEIPSKEKSKDIELTKYFKGTIANKLLSFIDIWQKCNDHLEGNEKLEVPIQNDTSINKEQKLSFSTSQIDAMLSFFLDSRIKHNKISSFYKRGMNRLSQFFNKDKYS